jgi:hypothetical protein
MAVKSAKSTGSKKAAARSTRVSIPDAKPYGDPMRDAIARGDLAGMKRLETTAVSWLSDTKADIADVQSTLKRMQTAMKKVRR